MHYFVDFRKHYLFYNLYAIVFYSNGSQLGHLFTTYNTQARSLDYEHTCILGSISFLQIISFIAIITLIATSNSCSNP